MKLQMKSVRSLAYKVVVTDRAKEHFRYILSYIKFVLKNPSAAKSVQRDMNETKRKLTYLAESLKLCGEPELALQGYRVILFQKHEYLMLYRVEKSIVYVDGIYHQFQNYQCLFR